VNTPLRRLATVVLSMFLILMAGATWVQYAQAPALNADSRNVRGLYREYGNARGPIVVAGQAIASSTPVQDAFGYQRSYVNGPLYAPLTGYYSVVYQRTGLESSENQILNGTADSLFLSRLRNLITGKQPQGSSVELTINPAAQQAAWDALGDQKGAVVAIDPSTGAILAMVSKPSYDPNALAGHDTVAVNAAYQALLAADGNPMSNRAINGDTYPPGSTFKLVTAAAALAAGRAPETQIAAPQTLTLPQSTSVLSNFGGETCSPTGTMTLADALRISCNTAFAQLGIDLGADALRKQAEAFGFDQPLDVPMTVTQSRFPDKIDVPQTALAAIGQGSVRVTPLQMAMVSAAIANHGVLMTPYTVATVRDPSLSVVSTTEPSVLATPVSPTVADALRQMMIGVVNSGTGGSARISGMQVAGKTGTAQTVDGAAPHAWFTAFAPADGSTPARVAVAVVVEHGGSIGNEATGGALAAPIARKVIQAVLGK
jgi:peptidoglycan glycosyltransferase